jgi:hypothetical protein
MTVRARTNSDPYDCSLNDSHRSLRVRHRALRARELRDRCMERQAEWLLPATCGKYDVSRALNPRFPASRGVRG